jgi:hypothetical protein
LVPRSDRNILTSPLIAVNRLTALMNAEELISSHKCRSRHLWAVDHNLTQNPWWICQLQTLGHSIYLFSDKGCSY